METIDLIDKDKDNNTAVPTININSSSSTNLINSNSTSTNLPIITPLTNESIEELTNSLNQSNLDFKSFSTATLPTLNHIIPTIPTTITTPSIPISPISNSFPLSSQSSPPPLFPRITSPIIPTTTTINSNNQSLASIGPGGSGSLTSSTGTAKRPGPGVIRINSGAVGSGVKMGVRGGGGMQSGEIKIPPSLQAKMAAMASRSSSSSSSSSLNNPNPPTILSSSAPNPRTNSSGLISSRQGLTGGSTIGSVGSGGGLNSRVIGPGLPKRNRPGLTLSAMKGSSNSFNSSSSSGTGTSSSSGGNFNGMGNEIIGGAGGSRGTVGEGSSNANNSMLGRGEGSDGTGTPFSNFRKIVDPSGRLNFASKAVVHADGVDFSSGASFKIKMDDFELYEELGKGNYGTVQKVWHKPTKVTMALKEIRLELDDSKLKTIITELDILHRATSPFIIDFYGAFFIESCVYYCMEYMDAGSLEKVAGCDVPEDVLSRVTRSMVEGLKFLKDELKIMHRDVKPTNVLINRKGFVKLCDFGVSGQLDRSLAKTNIGCQSYMAPERIKGESQGAPSSYTASSDVWSLGLSIIEFAIGHYPYPPETYSNVFAQLTAIVHGEPPVLPDRYSETARDFVRGCLEKNAGKRPGYGLLMEHPFLKNDIGRDVDMVGWINGALDYREKNPKIITPALA